MLLNLDQLISGTIYNPRCVGVINAVFVGRDPHDRSCAEDQKSFLEYETGVSYSPYLRCRRILIFSHDRVLIARISQNLVNLAIHGPGTSESGGL